MADRIDATDRGDDESAVEDARERSLRALRDDASRGRSAFERRLARIIEAHELARIRRERVAAYAAGLRNAAVFANAAAAEAERAADPARAARERLVAERSAHEAKLAEAQAAAARTDEERLRAARSELERHIAAQREIERRLASERVEADRRVTAPHDADAGRCAHDAVVQRIAELRGIETDAARERAEHKHVLAAFEAGEPP